MAAATSHHRAMARVLIAVRLLGLCKRCIDLASTRTPRRKLGRQCRLTATILRQIARQLRLLKASPNQLLIIEI